MTYIPNPNNYTYIDHIDTDPFNNHYTNLRWCTQEQNMNNPLTKEKLGRKVIQYDLSGNKLARFNNVREASAASGIQHTSIIKVASGVYNKTGEYKWKYAE